MSEVFIATFIFASTIILYLQHNYLLSSPLLQQARQSSFSNLFSTNFTFPSVEERIQYYMGDWFNNTLLEISCGEVTVGSANEVVSDKPLLYTRDTLQRIVTRLGKKDWRVEPYHSDALHVMDNTTAELIILHIGDSHSLNPKLPSVSKTRYSKYAVSKDTGKPFFSQIIWPLSTERHYGAVDNYAQLAKRGNITSWEDKKSTLIWRGGVTNLNSKPSVKTPIDSPRTHVVSKYYNHNTSDVDIAFSEGSTKSIPLKYRSVEMKVRGTHTTVIDQLKFKYILSLEGNDVATGLKWQLASNSVVFMSQPKAVSFLMEDKLVPFVHYVPLNEDYSNIMEMLEWARLNDEKCKWIAEQSTMYMKKLWMSEGAKEDNARIRKGLADAYQNQFGEAMGVCLRNDKNVP